MSSSTQDTTVGHSLDFTRASSLPATGSKSTDTFDLSTLIVSDSIRKAGLAHNSEGYAQSGQTGGEAEQDACDPKDICDPADSDHAQEIDRGQASTSTTRFAVQPDWSREHADREYQATMSEEAERPTQQLRHKPKGRRQQKSRHENSHRVIHSRIQR